MSLRRIVVLVAATAALTCGAPSTTGKSRLRDISSVAELKAAFERDAGRPRLVLLLSPT
jgi:hypothetical protein